MERPLRGNDIHAPPLTIEVDDAVGQGEQRVVFCSSHIPTRMKHGAALPNDNAAGAHCLRVVAYGYIAYAWGMVTLQAFNGAGDTLTPTKINFFCFWLLEIPLAYLLALKLGANESGVYWSILVAETAAGLLGIALFRRGKWKRIQV